MRDDASVELLTLSQRLLDSIAAADWATYSQLCDPSLSAFEPEARGHLVEGLAFHQTYFGAPCDEPPRNTMSSPMVRLIGDAAVVTYVRLTQRKDQAQGDVLVSAVQETRVWQRRDDQWRHVHFHRSPA